MGLMSMLFGQRGRPFFADDYEDTSDVLPLNTKRAPVSTPPISPQDDPYTVKKPGFLTYLTRGPIGYDQQSARYDQYRQSRQEDEDMSGLLQTMRSSSDPRAAELDWFSSHPRYAKMGVDMMTPKPQAMMNVGPNSHVVDPSTGKSIYDAPEASMTPYQQRRLAIEEARLAQGGDNNPKPPSGWRYDDNGDLKPIKGGPAWMKLQASKVKADSLISQIKTTSENVLSSIATAKKLASDFGTTGLIGSTMSKVPGSEAHDLQAAIDTIVANIGFDRLTQMRQSSPTGGALGAVSDRELTLLSSVVASLKQSQSQPQLLANLKRVEAQYQRTLQAVNDAYAEDYGDMQGEPSGSSGTADPLGIRK